MGKLIYSTITSLDGFVEDAAGGFEWATPDDEIHFFINDLERPMGTQLYGRRMYETMLYWETNSVAGEPVCIRDFTRIWRSADKVVFSRTLTSPSSARTRIEREFRPDIVEHLEEITAHDLSIGGADLAGQAIRAGLVDELHVFTVPVLVGGGKPWFPREVHLDLRLEDTRRFGSGVLYSRYRL